ncbi:MAG: preprotein translocase subunit YajC [Bacteroidaceae bacterium]|nr:preprotein translocase subunit YajC [Bacteroidaceae bacterium]
MSTMLMLDPFQMTVQEVVSQNTHIQTLVQDVNLDAPAEGAAQGGKSGGMQGGGLLLILFIFMIMMLFLPKGRDKEGEKFRNALQKEQDVVTSSGIFGKIKDIDEVSVTLEIAQGMRIKVDKRYVNPIPTPQPAKPEKKSRRQRKQDPSKDEKAK